LPVSITYNGSTTAPSASAAYTVVATVTNPNYSGSATNYLYLPQTPVILSVSTNGDNELGFTWSAMAQVNYQVVYCPDTLNPPITWANLNGPVTATGSVMTATDTLGGTNRSYRVELLLQ
ncbi:MAG: MBG domain-containing protein, partial [Verrucomicrobiota bacterium]